MSHDPRASTRPRRRLDLCVLPLERRALLSGAASGHQVVSIQLPSAYISQQSSQLDVTLVRTSASGRSYTKGPLTVDFSATNDSTTPDALGTQFTPVHQSVTFPAGLDTETVAIPINNGAANPGLVPIELAVTSSTRQVNGSSTTAYLASSADAIPPSIIGVQRAAGGIAVTFSKPMDPATVENVHNYAIKFSPTQNFNLESLYGVGLVQTLTNTSQNVPVRRASYNPATNTVLLVATEQLGSNGSYRVSSPASLLAKKARAGNAHPLTDTVGNVLSEGGRGGSFSITISKGKPYAAEQPSLAVGS